MVITFHKFREEIDTSITVHREDLFVIVLRAVAPDY